MDPRHEEQVLDETVKRLARVWPGIRPQQVLPLSSTEVMVGRRRGRERGERDRERERGGERERER